MVFGIDQTTYADAVTVVAGAALLLVGGGCAAAMFLDKLKKDRARARDRRRSEGPGIVKAGRAHREDGLQASSLRLLGPPPYDWRDDPALADAELWRPVTIEELEVERLLSERGGR